MTLEKAPKESYVVSTEMVLPNDTNPLNNLMGGHLLHLMDVVAAISAQKHSNRIVVTASVDNVSFKHSPKLGDVITLEAHVTRAFNSSMEVFIRVWSENIPNGTKVETNQAFFTFVAVDQTGRPITVPKIKPETNIEKKLYEEALQRREVRLMMAGRMKPKDATSLHSIFEKKEEGK
ncbi:acyl-CoA thioesterase [Flammeovirga yaeyamensis]|uniref:Acyl-CoA thioesterase n=1 Tax=Flammeovirga yaeyamensis TaxID=367791 RepID=A0AAX1NAN9_9BACT|nr:acyl-CoA thioesterase [Flammeovirga yaeyamensis]MBB3697324.1 acyl-CoA hydrolase [Flammeovirga yaeyamensis]NMF36018.1 acyl-CoA thioesterase [Flammeovirga yaeyamensis]QWG02753.1 acyl-CoA thioesterase [Flammeovirga yaeyamensis]